MASLTLSASLTKRPFIINSQFCSSRFQKALAPSYKPTVVNHRLKALPLFCSKLFSWEASSPYTPIEDEDNSIIKQSNIVDSVDTEDFQELSNVQSKETVFEIKSEQTSQHQPLKWPMWLLGPSVLLITGMVPTLWLPLSSVFLGPNVAGLLSLVGLDCIFSMGATLFLLMADSCAKPKGGGINLSSNGSQVPISYRFWNLCASFVGFIGPLLMLFASHKGYFQPKLLSISFLVLLGPYLLLLATQVLTETLTWHWKSPVWLLTPIVYEGYRVLQLMRGLQLGVEIGAPEWIMLSIRGLVSWWVLVFGIQLMRVAWFAGRDVRIQRRS
ncbi:uncharacterized protein A4U43_C10F260 [Asparagus officinalis]|uniref:Transmembrane protein n=1 Tax=Asparagus officinalis TaxID=4686 RepID=A0A5P1E2Q6_ASPOF|nr:uncharacterized protein LOC109825920 [Asparagus officinalis]XP_020248423.1 uncharacterized protein LOC109825920 [Asparagus officinalis]XP_020248424.1 uncharacterized protein LOC109825920 [Asparagus officinalis]ONK55715.1 uncharacterized protein A4U43_C10F260 [Asparagus officinalis]